jgi:N-methylhydantoinase A
MRVIGVDIGGTFTDCLLCDGGVIRSLKLASTPQAPGCAALDGIRSLAATGGISPAALDLVAHGTTVGTNALIEGRGAVTALLTTGGFRDVLEIGPLRRPPEALYNIRYRKPPPLIPRSLRYEVTERVNYRGEVTVPLALAELDAVAADLCARKVEALAVAFLFAYLNPAHERQARARLREVLPNLPIVISSEIIPEIREYERTSTTAISAYLAPATGRYLAEMREELAAIGAAGKFYVMQSNGGLTTPESLVANPATLVLSGPAAGVTGAVYLGRAAGFSNLISVDMGGTSFDVALVRRGEPLLSTTRKVREAALRTPMIDIQSIGAGGGSIAWLDPAGRLHVGPQSAGAEPGPAAYGRGGAEPTVTDADLLLGYLNPDFFLGGRMRLDAGQARVAIQGRVAEPLGMTPEEAAWGIRRIVDANMAQAIRLVSVEKGYDPRDFVLFAFGGAGPTHGADLMLELGIPWMVVPPVPGLTSAYGLLAADLIHHFVQTFQGRLDALDARAAGRELEGLLARAREALVRDQVPAERLALYATGDLKYAGQGYTLEVPLPPDPFGPDGLARLREAFHARHEEAYGFRAEGEPVELVNLRVRAVGRLDRPPLTRGAREAVIPPGAERGARRARFALDAGHAEMEVAVWDRTALRPGNGLKGPAILEQADSTVVVPPSLVATVDAWGNVVVGREPWKVE